MEESEMVEEKDKEDDDEVERENFFVVALEEV